MPPAGRLMLRVVGFASPGVVLPLTGLCIQARALCQPIRPPTVPLQRPPRSLLLLRLPSCPPWPCCGSLFRGLKASLPHLWPPSPPTKPTHLSHQLLVLLVQSMWGSLGAAVVKELKGVVNILSSPDKSTLKVLGSRPVSILLILDISGSSPRARSLMLSLGR